MPVIEVEHLHKQYHDQVAVDDLSFTVERGEIFGALEAGATGYLLKDAPREELIRAVRAAFAGEAVLSPAVASRLMGQVRKPPPHLTARPWTYSSWRRIQVWKPSSSSRPFGARSRMG